MQISVARNSESGTLKQLPAALGLTQKYMLDEEEVSREPPHLSGMSLQ